MIQLKDVTASFNYNQKKIENKLLSTINACLSHELRNPLNSIIAQSLQKSVLYDKLEKLILEKGVSLEDTEAIARVKDVLNQLRDGKKVQDSAVDMMSFLIQDFLDYSQIKEGKFRKNNKLFNIKEAIKKVMSIQ